MIAYDITFIGSGMSCVTVLIEFLGDALSSRERGSEPIKIAVVESHKEMWTGLPYGDRSWVNCLTISSLGNFLTDPKHLGEFGDWLQLNKSAVISEYKELGGDVAEKWCRRNADLLEVGCLKDIPIPRYWFGKFKTEKLTKLIERANAVGFVDITPIHAVAKSMDRTDQFAIHLLNEKGEDSQISSEKVILCTGHLPYKKDAVLSGSSSSRVLQNLYDPHVECNLDLIQSRLQAIGADQSRNLLLVGSNSTAVELLNLVFNRESLRKQVSKITVISNSGQFPKASVRGAKKVAFHFLNNFSEAESNIPSLVAEAMLKEFELLFRKEVCMDALGEILQRVRALLSDLSEQEYAEFLLKYGDDITRSTRRIAKNNLAAVHHFLQNDQLEILCGRIHGITDAQNEEGLYLKYEDGSGVVRSLEDPFHMVVSCIGFESIQDCSCPLIRDAITKGLCRINKSGKGIAVNASFEASPGLYINGPLLAGNVNETIHFWHLENVSRLLFLAPFLSDRLHASLDGTGTLLEEPVLS